MMKLSQFFKIISGSLLVGIICPALVAQDALVTNVSRFEIPFELEVPAGETPQGFAVLFSSIDNGATWEKLQTVPAAQQAFQFAAPRDGTYAFAVRMTDAAGNLKSAIVGSRPELQVTVDSTAPDLRLELYETSPGNVVLNWQTTDTAADLNSLKLEYADGQDGRWVPIANNATATGQTSLSLTPGSVVTVRGWLVDAAGNEGRQSAQLVLKPSTNTTQAAQAVAVPQTPMASGSQPMGLNPFAGPQMQQGFGGAGASVGQVPGFPSAPPVAYSATGFANTQVAGPNAGQPPGASYQARAEQKTAPAGVVGQPVQMGQPGHVAGALGVSNSPTGFPTGQGQLDPSLTAGQQVLPRTPVAVAPVPLPTESSLVNSQLFDLVYQVEDVGPSGVGAVDVYITEDGGQQWFRYGSDPDLRSPFQVDVQGEGTFGFAIRVRNGLGFVDPPPQPGESPTIVVTVDQTAPQVQLATPVVQADGTGVVDVRWQMADRLPAAAPVRLEYSTTAAGPWTPAFDWQADTGGFQWPVRPGTPGALYFRLLARDAAGNVTAVQTPEPVLIDLQRPTVRSVRVQAVSSSRAAGGY